MASIINASTTSGLIQTADTSGTLALQSNGTTQIAVSSTGVTLSAGGSTQLTVSSTGAYGQLKSGTAVTCAGQTSIDFTSIPSWVKRITVMFNNVSSSGTSVFLLQIGDSGGIENTGYSCLGSTISASAAASAEYTAGFGIGGNAYTAASTYSGLIVLDYFDTNTWCVNGSLGGVGQTHTKIVSGAKTLSAGPLTQVRITTVNGTDTFDTTPSAGAINILYEG